MSTVLDMRVLHVINDLDPKAGGPPVVAVSLAAAQTAAGAHAAIAVSEGTGHSDRLADFPYVPGLGRVAVHQVEAPRLFSLLVGAGNLPLLTGCIERSDVVHLHGVWEPVLVAAARACQRLHKPYVVLLNGMLEPWPLSQKRVKKQLALRLVYRDILNRAGALHVLNEDERRYTQQLGLKSDLRVIPNGIFDEQIKRLPAPGGFRAKHKEIGERPFVLFVGRLHVVKGLDILAEAFSLVAEHNPDAMLVVVGPDGGAEGDFATRISDLRIRDRVLMTGPIYGDAKYEALVDATCFCLPSRQEAFSVAILEALSCGKPVVISDQCHFPEVGDAGAGFICPPVAQDIATHLQRLLTDDAMCGRMGLAAQELVQQRFTWSRVAQMTLDLYKSLHQVRKAQ